MKLVELSINNHIVDAIHKHDITQHVIENSTSAPNGRVLRTTQLAKLSFNHPSVVLTADVFQYFYKIKSYVRTVIFVHHLVCSSKFPPLIIRCYVGSEGVLLIAAVIMLYKVDHTFFRQCMN